MRAKGAVPQDLTIKRVSSGNPELDSFLGGGFPKGSLILVSGTPGTGKTTLSASFLYYGAAELGENGVYVSFSEGKHSFYENMASMGLDFQALEKKGHFKFLEMFSASKEGMNQVTKFILEEIRTFHVKRLVIDSYTVMGQALGDKYEGRQTLSTFFSRIVRNMDCTTLVIGEQPTDTDRTGDSYEEFVADGVLNLKLTIPRELEIRKMRGTRLETRRLLFTIDDGFKVVTTSLQEPQVAEKWKPIPDSRGLISTGSPDLDRILGGGFPRGSYAVLEPSVDVTVAQVGLFIRPLILNFITQGRGAIIIPTGGIDSKEIKRGMIGHTTEATFNEHVRISQEVEPRPSGSRPKSVPRYLVPVPQGEGARKESELAENSRAFDRAYYKLKAKTGDQPVLRIIGYDTLESSYARFPDRLLNEVGIAMMNTRTEGNLTVAIGRPTVSILEKILGMVDWHIKLSTKAGVLLMQGVKPNTNIYAVDCDVSKGYPVTTLKMLI